MLCSSAKSAEHDPVRVMPRRIESARILGALRIGRAMNISREDLYHRVWATPMRTVAKEFGVSDVGLSKACRRHAVPTPPPGYWTQLQHGKAAKRPPLPAAPHGNTVSLSDDRSAA
jgi:hypothetical protein